MGTGWAGNLDCGVSVKIGLFDGAKTNCEALAKGDACGTKSPVEADSWQLVARLSASRLVNHMPDDVPATTKQNNGTADPQHRH